MSTKVLVPTSRKVVLFLLIVLIISVLGTNPLGVAGSISDSTATSLNSSYIPQRNAVFISWNEKSKGSIADGYYSIGFYTEPEDVGSITFAGTTYTNGQSGEYAPGTYQIEANVPQGYVFDSWITTGDVSVANPESRRTTASVVGGGSFVAFFKWFVKLRGTVISHVYDLGVMVKVEELLLDTSNRLRVGEVVEVFRKTPFTEINDGDYVEVYGLGFLWWPLGTPEIPARYGIDIKWPEHYIKRVSEELSVDVWTDKGGKGVGNYNGGTYSIGDDITLYCSVNTDVDFLKVWVEKPNGTVVLFEGSAKAGTYEFHGKVGEPAGERVLKAYAYKSGQTAKDETKFYAIAANKPPTLTLFEPQVSGLTVTVNGVANPGYGGASITRIHWDWGDGSKEDHWFPATHTYSSAGTYTITVTAYQSDGLSTTKTLSVKVGAENKPPTAYIDSISPNPAYEGQTISFSGHGYDPDGNITECDWRADGTVLSSSCSFSTSLPPGKYTIYFRVKDDKGAWSKWVYATVNVQSRSFTAFISDFGAPSSASPGQDVNIRLSVYYIFPAQTYLSVTISRKLPNGSYEKIWGNPDYNVPKTGGPYYASYTASLSVPSTEGTYNYRVRVYYWNGNQWVKTDEKYFDIKVEIREKVIVKVAKGESLRELGDWYTFEWNIGVICDSGSGYCELERKSYNFHAVIEKRGLLPESWEPIVCSHRDFDLDLSKFKGNELTIYVEFDEKACKTWIHTEPPGFTVRETSSNDIKIEVSGPHDDWFNWFRALLGWGRIYKYEVTVKNVGGDVMMITSFHTIVDPNKFKEIKQVLKEAPSQEGRINEAYMKIARVALGQSVPIGTVVDLVKAVYLGGPEFATLYSIFPAKLPEKIKNTIEDFASKYPSKTGGDVFISLPTVEVRIFGWGLTKAVAPVVLKPGDEAKFEIVVEEVRARSAAGVKPEFMVTAMTAKMRVDTQELLPFWDNVANFVLSKELEDFHLGWNSVASSPVPS